jgi:hypothetical protein
VTSPGTMSPSAANASGSSPRATPATCHKQAADKQLTGDDKANFINGCKKGKVSRAGS